MKKQSVCFIIGLMLFSTAGAASVLLEFDKVQVRDLQFSDSDEVRIESLSGEEVVGNLSDHKYVFSNRSGSDTAEVRLYLPAGHDYVMKYCGGNADKECCCIFNDKEMIMVKNDLVKVCAGDKNCILKNSNSAFRVILSGNCIQLVNQDNCGILRMEGSKSFISGLGLEKLCDGDETSNFWVMSFDQNKYNNFLETVLSGS